MMEHNQKSRRTWLVLGLSALLTASMVAIAPQSATAGRSDRNWRHGRRNFNHGGLRNSRFRDRDGDGIPNRWDRQPNRWNRRQYWRRGWRRNGVRNRWYRYPSYPGYLTYPGSPWYRSNDLDRDGVRDFRDRDRDGDGVPNYRDRYPNNRWRR